MRKIFYLLLLLLPLSAFAQQADSAWMVKHYIKKERYIRMRDGVKLFTSTYMSKDSSHNTHPILLLRTPYSCAPYGRAWIPFWNTYLIKYFKAGYDLVFEDVRGRWMSEGEFVDIRPFIPNKKTNNDIDESSDAYDTIDWLVKNVAGNNGNVGAVGTSYPGFYTAMAALSGHPALKAVSPQAPVTDWFIGDDFHHNGVFMLEDMFDFYVGWNFGAPHPKPTMVDAEPFANNCNDSYAWYLQMGALPAFTKIADKQGDKFWLDVMEHPNYDAWWTARNDRNYMAMIPPGLATLVVGGLFDAEDCFGTLNLYKSIAQKAANNNKLVFGPWYHGQWGNGDGTHLGNIQFGSNTAVWYEDNIELPFFNYYLKSEGSADSIAEATVFFTGENKWHKLAKWPPAAMQPTDLFLQQGGKLSFTKPTSVNGFEEYVSDLAKPVPYAEGIHKDRIREYMDADQHFAGVRPDVLSFETDTLTSDITLAGPLIADLQVSISTTDADFVVKLIDVFPVMNGYQMLVRGDIFRGRYRNSFAKPEAFTPGKTTEIKYTLNDIAHTFKKGHRIMVQIQSTWFPLADRNPQQFIDIYHAKDSDFIKSTVRIHLSANAASKIILPVLR